MAADIAKLLEAAASLLWPFIVLALVVKFEPAVRAIIESAKSRKFTLKIGGQELTVDEANTQQRLLIEDLQAQVVSIRKILGQGQEARVEAAVESPRSSRRNLLWVDDQPKNNSTLVQMLTERGASVDLALTTDDAMHRLDAHNYRAIVSDMARDEYGKYRVDAGLDLLRRVREKDSRIPFFIYCSKRRVDEFQSKARELGATAITWSPTEMAGLLGAVMDADA